MKYYSEICCPKCGNKLLIYSNKVVCVYCDTEEDLIDEQVTTKPKRKKSHQNITVVR